MCRDVERGAGVELGKASEHLSASSPAATVEQGCVHSEESQQDVWER